MPVRPNTREVRDFILNQVEWHGKDIARITAERFGISRPAVTKRLRHLIDAGQLESTGETRAREYKAVDVCTVSESLPITPGLSEDTVWTQFVAEKVDFGKTNVRQICSYGFTEMFNNVLDHSEGSVVYFHVFESVGYVDMRIVDNGVGIFKKIKDALNLADERESILELSKGKFTTDPDHHSGEGVFFTSRMFDYFVMISGGCYFGHFSEADDWFLEGASEPLQGTWIRMKISKNSPRETKEVFDTYATVESPGFYKTHVPVGLAKYGKDNLVSRSQAKRVLARFNRFTEVFLDFDGVETIGQGFADEIFRVFRNQNPDIKLIVTGASPGVQTMIDRVRANAGIYSDSRQRKMDFSTEE